MMMYLHPNNRYRNVDNDWSMLWLFVVAIAAIYWKETMILDHNNNNYFYHSKSQHQYKVSTVVHGFVIPHHHNMNQNYNTIHRSSAALTATSKTRYTTLRGASRPHGNQNPTFRLHAMIEYTGEGNWDTAFIEEQIKLVPLVQIVNQMPEPLPPASTNHNNNDDDTNHNKIHYYLLRHGQSTANVAEVISSDRFALSYTEKHGLTELGILQATASAQPLLQMIQERSTEDGNGASHHRVIFVSSPFARARQTALACRNGIHDLIRESNDNIHETGVEIVPSIWIHNSLVERYFGIYDNDTLETYGYVWPLDQHNVTHTTYNVESVAAVATRIQSLILQLNPYMTTPYDTNDDSHHNHNNNNTNNTDPRVTNHIVLVSHGDVVQIAQLYAANVTNVGEFSSYRFQSRFVIVVWYCVGIFLVAFRVCAHCTLSCLH
jgi:broad specificity phosphatase PhoE